MALPAAPPWRLGQPHTDGLGSLSENGSDYRSPSCCARVSRCKRRWLCWATAVSVIELVAPAVPTSTIFFSSFYWSSFLIRD